MGFRGKYPIRDVSLRVHKAVDNYYLEASADGEVLSDVMLSSPYSGLNGIILDEGDMAQHFAITEAFYGGNYIAFMTGDEDVRFFTVYFADDTGVYPITLQGGEDNVFEGKPRDELSYYGQYVYLGDELIMMEYRDTYIPIPEAEEGMTWIATFNTGENVYLENGTQISENVVSYPFALMRYSTGKYADSLIEPELFECEDEGMYEGGYTYIGDAVTTEDMFPYSKVSAGYVLEGRYTVDEAVLNLYYYENEDGTYNSYTSENSIHISEDITLTGSLRYFGEDCDYAENGDLVFIPDGSYAGLPIPVSDAVPFLLGNYFVNYSENTDLISMYNDICSDGNSWASMVKITLSDVWMSCSVENGLSGSAVITSVEGVS